MTAKTCTKCDETKPLDEFFRKASAKDGRTSDCKACRTAGDRAKYAANPEPKRVAARTYRAENLEVIRGYDRKRGNEHTKRWRAANPERDRATKARWRAANPDAVNASHAARRAAKLAATVGKVSYQSLRLAFPDCYLCGLPLSGKLAYDHVHPLARGGAHFQQNIRPTHATCNLRKGDRLLSELSWYVGPLDLGWTVAAATEHHEERA